MLITLAIIGVVAAIAVPSVISNSQQSEFRTGLRKAVSVLNSAITMNMALEGESPYDNANLFGYLMKHMSVMYSGTNMLDRFNFSTPGFHTWNNAYFYTTDGMRFEFYHYTAHHNNRYRLYETPSQGVCLGGLAGIPGHSCGGCGSLGLLNNIDETTKPPCMIAVDVNGDRKPSPTNVNCKTRNCANSNQYKFSDAKNLRLSDIFSIMITDKQAIPYGVAAQRAMYQAQK